LFAQATYLSTGPDHSASSKAYRRTSQAEDKTVSAAFAQTQCAELARAESPSLGLGVE
jgi:hypothetical protein